MTVRAVLRDGSEVTIDSAEHGGTLDEVVLSVTKGSLTGSASPLATAELKTTEGRTVPYSEVNQFLEDKAF